MGFYILSKKDLRDKKASDFNEGDIVEISDSHFQIFIKFGEYTRASLCSKVFDISKGTFQDIVFRPRYIDNFLHS